MSASALHDGVFDGVGDLDAPGDGRRGSSDGSMACADRSTMLRWYMKRRRCTRRRACTIFVNLLLAGCVGPRPPEPRTKEQWRGVGKALLADFEVKNYRSIVEKEPSLGRALLSESAPAQHRYLAGDLLCACPPWPGAS